MKKNIYDIKHLEIEPSGSETQNNYKQFNFSGGYAEQISNLVLRMKIGLSQFNFLPESLSDGNLNIKISLNKIDEMKQRKTKVKTVKKTKKKYEGTHEMIIRLTDKQVNCHLNYTMQHVIQSVDDSFDRFSFVINKTHLLRYPTRTISKRDYIFLSAILKENGIHIVSTY
ncbi:MAG: hypothetical protein KF763_13095 [Cyclobacteriaceae bacterium]|nr:hypothetical protein [Cyclobacteriaceae bacterium]